MYRDRPQITRYNYQVEIDSSQIQIFVAIIVFFNDKADFAQMIFRECISKRHIKPMLVKT